MCAFFSFPGNDGKVPCQICQSDVNSGHSESMSKDVLISPRSEYLLLVRSDENGGFGQIKKIGKQWFFSTESEIRNLKNERFCRLSFSYFLC